MYSNYSFLVDYKVKHFSFDFWNTIAFSNSGFKQKRAEYLEKKLILNVGCDSINDTFKKIGQEYNFYQESGQKVCSSVELLQKVIYKLDSSFTGNIYELKSDLDSLFIEFPPLIDKNFLIVLEKILDSGYTCSITSNTGFISGFTIKLFLKNIGLLDKFSFTIFSDEEGIAKPNFKIFETLFNKVKIYHSSLKLDEVIHIGDNLLTDYNAASMFGIQSFLLKPNQRLFNERFAVHEILTPDVIPFDAIEYSKFKFGDSLIAKKYGQELFEYFCINHLNNFIENSNQIIIYSSPYTYVPTSSYFLAQFFYEDLINYLNRNNIFNLKVSINKICRLQTYTVDYGAMNAIQRYDLIKNDTYSFHEEPSLGSNLIFIDDISITGTHQLVVENLLQKNNISNICLFLYYAKLSNNQISPSIENDLNYAYIKTLDNLLCLMESKSFKLTTRTIKYILKLDSVQFYSFIRKLITCGNETILEEIFRYSIKNGYYHLADLKGNLENLESFIKNPKI